MLRLFTKKSQKALTFRDQLSSIFGRIKEDLSHTNRALEQNQQNVSILSKWIDYLHQNQQDLSKKHQELHTSHQKLNDSHSNLHLALESRHHGNNKELELTKQELGNIRTWVKHVSSYMASEKSNDQNLLRELETLKKQLSERFNEQNQELDKLKQDNYSLRQKLEKVHTSPQIPIQNVPKPEFKTGFEQKVMARLRPNRKSYVLQEMKKLISEAKFSTKEIEEIIVNEKNLCGRTSFYAYLKELKDRGSVAYSTINEQSVLVIND
jgi:chromosome segregation ATPase